MPLRIIAEPEQIIYHSPDPANVYCYSPWIDHAFDGRLVLSYDISGEGLLKMPGPKTKTGDFVTNQLHIYISDDRGHSWRQTGTLPMYHTRVFAAGKSLYALGHDGVLLISRSTDNGETWEEPVILDGESRWHQAPCAIERRRGKIFLVMEHQPNPGGEWQGGDPVLMSADENADLTKRESWVFSNKLQFEGTVPHSGYPFGGEAWCWLESNVVRQRDENSLFYDPEDREFMIFMRIERRPYSHFNHFAALVRGYEAPDGTLTLDLFKQPDGSPIFMLPFPGGHMKFHLVFDDVTRLWWLVSSRTVHSSFEKGLSGRFPGEREILELSFSRNLTDWCSAGVVAYGLSRHYASVCIDGEDLLIACRSGDEQAINPHDTDVITLHRVKNFREMV